MILADSKDKINTSSGSVVALGVFDGVHLGHQALLQSAKRQAESLNIPMVVVTFSPNPLQVLAPNKLLKSLSTLAERIDLCKKVGADQIVVLEFNTMLSHVTATDFIEKYLVEKLNAKAVAVGKNFRFGFKGAGNVDLLKSAGKKFNFEVLDTPLLTLAGEPISSTRIRKALEGGEVTLAAKMLGRNYALSGPVIHGEAIGRTLGFPTANIPVDFNLILPKDGVYSGWLRGISTKENTNFPCAISIGTKPTFDKEELFIEAHILNFNEDIYGENVEIIFDKFIRGQLSFANMDDLITQMHKDITVISDSLLA